MAAEISHFPLFSFDDLLIDIKNKTSPQIILILDSIHDPQNVGAIIRSACATGVDAIIIAKTGQAPINSTIAKTSAGRTGVSSLLHRASDFRVYLPMINTESLNVNAATAVLLYEIRKKQNF
ncbi:uncharacterized protein LOC110988010 [Acanthaster planci]|uniref:Uncharacterized protein LOC110988010 n=1 Tax=Acanthaster planci TaxID=133434 RepID=A0A8B7ZMU4_ACAPL|nr:uncharacterized protein LOC110988010 [Acanthaster planci]